MKYVKRESLGKSMQIVKEIRYVQYLSLVISNSKVIHLNIRRPTRFTTPETLTMSYQNRTTEFFSLCQSLPSNNPSSAASSTTAPPPTGRYGNNTTTNGASSSATTELISFHQTASYPSQKYTPPRLSSTNSQH